MPKKPAVFWTGPALEDLESIRRYVASDKPRAAKALAKRIRSRVEGLLQHPHSGRVVPEFPSSDYREVIVAPYRIVYQPTQQGVIVLRVWHGRRELKATFG